MKLKMFEMKGRLGLAKQKVFRLFRGSEGDDAEVSSPVSVPSVAPYEVARPFATHSFEADMRRDQALTYYRKMMDRPR